MLMHAGIGCVRTLLALHTSIHDCERTQVRAMHGAPVCFGLFGSDTDFISNRVVISSPPTAQPHPPARWLSVRLEVLGSSAALLAAVVAVEQRGAAARAGLVLSYAMQVGARTYETLFTTGLVMWWCVCACGPCAGYGGAVDDTAHHELGREPVQLRCAAVIQHISHHATT